jgi:hypothetical protein
LQIARRAGLLVATATLAVFAGPACTDTASGPSPWGDASADGPADGLSRSDGAGTDDGGAGLAAVDAFISGLAQAMCAWQFGCCSLAEIDSISGSSYLTEADCLWATSQSLATWFGNARASVGDNRSSLDAPLADACVQRFQSGACASPSLPALDPFSLLQLCADPFVGRVPVGSLCQVADECVPGARCVQGGQTTNSIAGMTTEGLSPIPNISYVISLQGSGFCQAYVPEGGKCRVTVDCAPGLYCRGIDFVCAKGAGVGEPCHPLNDPTGIPSVGPPCDDSARTLVCMGNVCGTLPRAGEPCLADPAGRPPCDTDAEPPLACVGAGFNGSGICEPVGKLGDACGTDGLAPCAADLACMRDATTPDVGTCSLAPALGEVCEVDEPCATPNVCSDDTATCAPSGAGHDGEPCLHDIDCASLNCFVNSTGGSCGASPNATVACTGRGAVSPR